MRDASQLYAMTLVALSSIPEHFESRRRHHLGSPTTPTAAAADDVDHLAVPTSTRKRRPHGAPTTYPSSTKAPARDFLRTYYSAEPSDDSASFTSSTSALSIAAASTPRTSADSADTASTAATSVYPSIAPSGAYTDHRSSHIYAEAASADSDAEDDEFDFDDDDASQRGFGDVDGDGYEDEEAHRGRRRTRSFGSELPKFACTIEEAHDELRAATPLVARSGRVYRHANVPIAVRRVSGLMEA